MGKEFYVNENGMKSGPFTIEQIKNKKLDSSCTVMDSETGEWKPVSLYDFNKMNSCQIADNKTEKSSGSILDAFLGSLWFVFLYIVIYWGAAYLYQKFIMDDSDTLTKIMNIRLFIMGFAAYCCSPYTEAKGNKFFFWVPMVLSILAAVFSSNEMFTLIAGLVGLIEVIFWSAKASYRS